MEETGQGVLWALQSICLKVTLKHHLQYNEEGEFILLELVLGGELHMALS